MSVPAIPSAEALAASGPHPKVWTPPNTPLERTASVAGQAAEKKGQKTNGGVPVEWRAKAPAARSGTATVALSGVSPEQAAARKLTGGASPSAGRTASRQAGDLPVYLTDAAAGRAGGDPAVKVGVLDADRAKAAGATGAVVTLENAGDPAAQAGPVEVTLDVAALPGVTGWADRAQLVQLPACALTTPERTECQQRTPVPSVLDARTGRLTAKVELPKDAQPAGGLRLDSAPAAAPVGGGAMVLAAQAAPSGSMGSFAATPIAPSAAWSAGSNAGNFTYSYTFDMPTSIGGAAPGVMLGYDSSSVDGRTAANNSQSSWIGDGWDYSAGSISRSYKPCLKSGIDMSGDECWAGQSLQLNLAGHSGTVVKDDTSGVLRLQGDDGTQITPLTGLANGAWNGEGFKVTTTDGTQYYFGANHLPGGDGTDPATNSVNTVPVYHPHAGDPCYSSGTGLASWCQMGWQWNLDYIVDLHGNLISYKYAKEGNYYARGGGQNNGTGTRTAYDRYSNVTQIAYGQRLADQITAKGAAKPAARIDFTTSERCFAAGSITCSDAQRVVANQSSWPDTPLDQACAATGTCTNYGPSFWTSKRLTKVETTIQVAGAARVVDTWALNQVFSDPGDGTSPTLWLSSIQRTASNGQASATLPAVSFTAMQMANRVDGLVPAAPQFNRPRMSSITTETGGRINVTYRPVECSRVNGTMPASEAGNTMPCMPVKWVPPGSPANTKPVDDWFHKVMVASISEQSLVTSTVAKLTEYTYGGGAAWHRNDSEFADDDTRTYDNFRGYQTVTTTTGTGTDGVKTKSVATFLRGMGGQVTDSWGSTITDSEELAGAVRETQTYESAAAGAKVVSGELTTPWLSAVTATHTQTGNLPKVTARYSNTAQVKSRALLSDGTWRTTQRDATYDETKGGRVVTVDVKGDLAHVAEQQQCTSTSYATGSNGQLMELPYRVLTLAGPCGQTPTAANTVSDALTYYDGKALATFGTEANQTETRVLESYNTDGTPKYRITAQAEYDAYGRQSATTDPARKDTAHPNGARTSTVYLPATGELPTSVEVTNPLGWKSTTTVDPGRGLPTKAVDENNHLTEEAYDAFGRLTSVWLPGRDRATQSANRVFEYALNGSTGPSTVTSRSIREDGSYSSSIQIYDGLGRVRQSQSTPAFGTVGRLISEAEFDSHGWQIKATAAYYNADSGPVSTIFSPQDSQVPAQTWNEFDGLGRVTAARFMSYAQEQWRNTTAYPGAERVDLTPPAGGYATSTVTDATGATVELRQYQGNTPTGAYNSTTYGHDTVGKPLWRRDSTNHEWRYTYDLLGQQVSATDPDTGTSTSSYDGAGHLVTATDAKGRSTSFTYDLLGRKTAQFDGTDVTNSANQTASWVYDTKAKGKPTSSTTYVGGLNGQAYTSAFTGYDLGYRPTGTTVSIPSTEKTLGGTYNTALTYSAVLGLPKTTTLTGPTGYLAERITNSYDLDGNFIGSSGKDALVSDVQYDAFAHPTRTTVGVYGKQVVSTQQFDQGTGRVVQSTLDRQTGSTHVDLTGYTYNKAGALTSVSDLQDGTNTDLQCFTYDYLGRLTAAWADKGTVTTAPAPSVPGIGGCANGGEPTAATATTRVGGPAPYWQSYSYDLTGNRTKFVQHDVTGVVAKDKTVDQTFATGPNAKTTDPSTGGGTGGPHALLTAKTTVNGTSKQATYAYDETGKTTAITDTDGTKSLTWDNQGKVAKVDKSGTADPTSYVYDAGGNQLIRRTNSKVTLNLGIDEITMDVASTALTSTRYYGGPGGLTIARVTDAGGGKLYYQAADPHGTNGVQMDAATLTVVRRPTDPFGNPRGSQPGAGVWAGSKGFVGGTTEGTGFTNLGARQYDPVAGRFLSADPVFTEGDPQSWNGYAYADNNPVNHADPTGTCIPDDAGRCMSAAAWTAYFNQTNGSSGTGTGTGGGAPGTTTTSTSSDTRSKAAADLAAAQRQKQAADEALAKAKQQREELMSKVVDVVGDLIGFNDARDCFTKGDVMGCINTALNFVPWSKVFKAVKVGIKAFKLWKEGEKAYDAIRGAERVAKDAEEALSTARKTEKEASEAEQAATHADEGGGASACTWTPRPHSFPEGTPVRLADGSSKPIEQVQQGDLVVATDPQSGATTAEPVSATITTPDDEDFTDLVLRPEGPDGTSAGPVKLTSTWHHPYWDATTRKWVDAHDLQAGHRLRQVDGTEVTVLDVRNYHQQVVTHDLTITRVHTYYVLAGGVPVLVHNANLPEQCGPITSDTHFADVEVSDAHGNVIDTYSLRSGSTSPEEAAIGVGRARQAVHTEHRAARAAGGAPMVKDHVIHNDPYFMASPVPEGGMVRITGTKAPCGPCQKQMRLSAEDTASTFEYLWPDGNGGMNIWSFDG
ncbi:RHS repeat-associated core domain-containing protein [Kitasatospora albolonga]|uniref:RHS repeat-associated core domain-containing protein n=1 Tax=Kitasatospora albolonga TaxID=68173 RepID=UPI0031E60056